MADDEGFDTRAEILDFLLERVAEDTYPSVTMLDLIEYLAEPDEIGAYAAILMEKMRHETYPSASMIRRLVALTERR